MEVGGLAALQLGKHIYCAKPITHTIGEARKVKDAVPRSPKLVTKSSVQSSGTDAAVSTTELLSSGAIGPVRELHVWCDHPAYPCSLVRPTDTQTPPAGMDWDLWIGPAPFRPFHSAYHPENWRPWWDFGSGTLRTRRLLEWDSTAMRITNNPPANALIDPPYRSGWQRT